MSENTDTKMLRFTCRQCGSHTYSEITKSNGIIGPGYKEWVTGYACSGCSVRFDSPRSFSSTLMPSDEMLEKDRRERKRKELNPENLCWHDLAMSIPDAEREYVAAPCGDDCPEHVYWKKFFEKGVKIKG